jgi:hypothetical protein
MDTNALIAAIVADLKPVRRLLPPVWRLLGWLAVSVPAAAVVVALSRMRPDLAAKLAEPAYLVEQAAAVATALVAGWAALVACVPGAPRWKLWAPVVPLALWMLSLGGQCWDEWVRFGANGMDFRSDWTCVPSIALTGAIPALAIVIATRRGAPLSAVPLLWGSLAAAALANIALRLFHAEDAALMVIVWQFSSVVLFTTILTGCRRFLVPVRRVHRPI